MSVMEAALDKAEFMEMGEEAATKALFFAKTKAEMLVPNCSKESLISVIQGKILKGSTNPY